MAQVYDKLIAVCNKKKRFYAAESCHDVSSSSFMALMASDIY